MRTSILLVAGGIAMALASGAGCFLQDPSYDDTEFACSIPDELCPPGYACVEGRCTSDGELTGLPDAGVSNPEDPDAADNPGTTPDAGQDDPPDAEPLGEPVTATFGERIDADQRGVTTDSTMYLDQPNDNDGNNDEVRFDAFPLKYGLLRFDVSAIPVGATVVSAAIDVYVNDPIEDGEMVGYQVWEDWDENEVTYRHRRDNQRWTIDGAGSPSSAAATTLFNVAARAEGYYRIDLPAFLLQNWVSNPSSNAGIVIRSTSPGDRGGEFHSSEDGQAETRPLLIVTYR